MDENANRPEAGATPDKSSRLNQNIFRWFLIALAVCGAMMLTYQLFRPHQTGQVTSVGRLSNASMNTGVGKNRREVRGYAVNVKVWVKETSSTETVRYTGGNPENFPQVGDEIAFAYDWVVGINTPYPEAWAVKAALFILGLDALLWIAFWAVTRRKSPGKET